MEAMLYFAIRVTKGTMDDLIDGFFSLVQFLHLDMPSRGGVGCSRFTKRIGFYGWIILYNTPALILSTLKPVFFRARFYVSISELDALLASTTHVVVVFYADWRPPCRAIAPVFSLLAEVHAAPGWRRRLHIPRMRLVRFLVRFLASPSGERWMSSLDSMLNLPRGPVPVAQRAIREEEGRSQTMYYFWDYDWDVIHQFGETKSSFMFLDLNMEAFERFVTTSRLTIILLSPA